MTRIESRAKAKESNHKDKGIRKDFPLRSVGILCGFALLGALSLVAESLCFEKHHPGQR
jgi:hypothetical protein